MKTKFLKVSLLILAFSLVIGAAVATIVSADGTEPQKPEIVSQNLVYGEDFQIMFAVDASTVTSGSVTFKLYGKEPAQGVEPLKTEVVSTVTLTTDKLAPPVNSYIYITPGISYSQMLANYYVVAEANGTSSIVKRYSVAEYLYQRLADYTSTAEQKAFYNSSLAFGASIEEVVYNVAEADRVTNYRYVTVDGGTLSDGYTAGVYKNGTTLTLADTSKAWKNVKYDAIGDFNTADITAGSFTVADVAKNKITTSVINYNAKIDTLNKSTISESYINISSKSESADGKFYVPSTATTPYRYIADAEHGIVAEFDTTQTNSTTNHISARMPITDTNISAIEAKAFECSFDLKMIPQAGALAESIDIELRIWNTSDTSVGKYWFRYKRGECVPGSNKTAVYGSGNGDTVFNGADTSDWINVRMVVYSDDLSNIYLYLNNSTTYSTAPISITSLADIAGGGILAYTGVDQAADCIDSVLIDNIHSGYTDATLSQ